MLLDDTDVLLLFNPAMDGIENDDTAPADLGLGYLHSRDWFISYWYEEGRTAS